MKIIFGIICINIIINQSKRLFYFLMGNKMKNARELQPNRKITNKRNRLNEIIALRNYTYKLNRIVLLTKHSKKTNTITILEKKDTT